MYGAFIGDIVGSTYEFNNIRTKNFDIFRDDATFTDDTVLTVAVADALLHPEEDVAKVLQKWGRKYRNAGYGGRFRHWLDSENPKPYRSYGNGAAMRIMVVGHLAKTEEELKQLAKKVTEVTHNHPEGLKAAEVVAMCIFKARHGASKEELRKYIEANYNVDFDYEDLRKNYRFDETCQGSVPQALYCFLISNSFEDCLRTTISIGGDCDTTAAVSCAVAEAYYYNGGHSDEEDQTVYEQLVDYVEQRLPMDMKQTMGEVFQKMFGNWEIADD